MEPNIPPSDNDAEIAVLGAMLQDAGAVNTAEEMLVGLDFYKPKHETIFSAMLALSDKNEPVDILTVANKLGQKKLDEIGGNYYLTELVARTPSAANVSYHCQIVKDKSLLRRLSNIGMEIKSYADETGADARYVLEASEKMIFDVSMQKTRGGFISLPRIMHPTFEKIEGYHAKQGGITGIPSGLTELDALTCGWQNTDLIIVAGRPSTGKTSLVLAALKNAAIDHGEPVAIFSLEMASYQLATRLLCMDGRVNSHALRSGKLSKSDFQKLAISIGKFENAKIFIDETPALTVTELRARARRLKMQEGIKLLAVDYLQLMRVGSRDGRNYENRTVEVSIISQSLKALAKELDIPVIALSQLSRGVEQREDKRPILSDLRESGCLVGDTLIYLETGEYVKISELVGKKDFNVSSLSESLTIVNKRVSNAFCTGKKNVHKLKTRSGREIRATANHKFLTICGWKRLDELSENDHIAVPRILKNSNKKTMTDAELSLLGHLIGDGCTLPRQPIHYTTPDLVLANLVVSLSKKIFGEKINPRISRERTWYQVYLSSKEHLTHNKRNPISQWLFNLGIFGLRSYEKYVPVEVFKQPTDLIALFLRHLWSTDGCISMSDNKPSIYYSTTSKRLAHDVQSLFLRLGITAIIRVFVHKVKSYKNNYSVNISGRSDIEKFANLVGIEGDLRKNALDKIKLYLSKVTSNTNRDIIPTQAWSAFIFDAMKKCGAQRRDIVKSCGGIYNKNFSREKANLLASRLDSTWLRQLAQSDVYWDGIASISPDGEDDVYDLTVPQTENFIAGNIIAHNSIEQDSDLVIFVYRPDVYGRAEIEGLSELIIGKQRNGPLGTAKVMFLKDYTLFTNLAKSGEVPTHWQDDRTPF